MSKPGTDESRIDEAREQGDGVEEAVQSLVDVGRLWASHGLRAGRLALETSARTLKITADTLGDLSRRFEHDR